VHQPRSGCLCLCCADQFMDALRCHSVTILFCSSGRFLLFWKMPAVLEDSCCSGKFLLFWKVLLPTKSRDHAASWDLHMKGLGCRHTACLSWLDGRQSHGAGLFCFPLPLQHTTRHCNIANGGPAVGVTSCTALLHKCQYRKVGNSTPSMRRLQPAEAQHSLPQHNPLCYTVAVARP
jgi:hypothetical protein